MFFDSIAEIPAIATRTGFAIFVAPPASAIKIKNLLTLEPDEKTDKISIDAVRDFLQNTLSKQLSDTFFLVRSPEKMNPEAANAFLKTLEEPKPHYHFLFLTENPSGLLPTILSRAELFFLKKSACLDAPVEADEKIKDYAKRLLTLTNRELPAFAKEIADKKDRVLAKKIVATAIELSYKSFFKTGNENFLKTLPKLLELYENLDLNGHINLHFLADLMV